MSSDGVKSLRTFLLTQPAVTALVGNRIYPRALPQTYKTPCIAMFGITRGDEYAMGGQSDLTQYRIQVDCYGEDRQPAYDVATAVHNACSGYLGMMGAEEVQTCHMDTQRDDSTAAKDASGGYRHIVQQDWIIFFTLT